MADAAARPSASGDASAQQLRDACYGGDVEAARALLEAGAAVDARDEKGKTAMYFAAKRGDVRVMELLLDHGADLHAVTKKEKSVLYVAAFRGGVDAVRFLLERGHPVDVTDQSGRTALFGAAQHNDVEAMQVLLDYGLNLHALAKNKRTPLHDCVLCGSREAAAFLVSNGIATNAADVEGLSAFHHAAYGGDVDLLRMLIEHGADPVALTKDGRTALHFAANNGHGDAVTFLLEQGLSLDATDNDGWTAFHFAPTQGDVGLLRKLIEHGADLNALTKDGRSALHRAVHHGHRDAVIFLLEQGLPVDSADSNGISAFHRAAYEGNVDLLRVLIEHGADANAMTKDGRTALHFAVNHGHGDAVSFLLDQGLSVGSADNNGISAFHQAAYEGDVSLLRVLIEHGADPNSLTKDGRTALHFAVTHGHEEAVAFLLEQGLSVDSADNNGVSVFHQAAYKGNVGLLRMLIEHGVDARALSKDGRSALHYAAQEGYLAAVAVLLEQGLSADLVANDGLSAFHYAAYKGDVGLLRVLIEYGADASALMKDGRTALHLAAQQGHFEAVKFLSDHVSVNLTNKKGLSAFHYAAYKGDVRILRVLIDHGADANAVTKDGRTALHRAAHHGHAEAVAFLLKQDVAVNAVDEGGRTPLHIAATTGHGEIMRLLINHGAEVHSLTKTRRNIVHLAIEGDHIDALKVALEFGVDFNLRVEIDSKWLSPLLVAFHGDDRATGCEMAFVLCSSGASFAGDDRQTALAIGMATTVAHDEDVESNTRVESALWRSGLCACVDHWTQEYRAGLRDLTNVPIEVISRGEASVKAYLDDVARSTHEDRLYRCKVCVVGPSEWGKTSLVQSLKAESTILTHVKDRTVGIDLTTCELKSAMNNPPMRSEITFWDFAGQDVYHAAHSLFFSQRTLFVLVINLEAYWKELEDSENKLSRASEAQMNRFVSTKIFRWVRSIFAHRPDAQFVVVGSKVDRLDDARVIDEIWDDLRDHLDHWKASFAKGVDRDLLPASASKKDIKALQTKVAQLVSSDWLVANIMDVESIRAFGTAVQTTIASSHLGFPMWKTYTRVLQSIVQRRDEARRATSAGDRMEKSIVRFSSLRRRLLRENDELDREACEQILRTLNDLGDILWYEHDGAGVFKDCIILDPMLVIEIVREVIRHDFSNDMDGKSPIDGRITHSLLSTFPLWRDMDVELMHAFKSLLQHFQLAYPADADEMLPESDIIVPAYWNTDRTAISRTQSRPKLVASQKSLCDAFAQHRWCWEYEISSELSETVFVQFAVQSHSSYLPRSIRGFCVEAGCAEFATSISLIQRDSPRDVLRIEVSGVSAELSWYNMQFYLMKMEKVLEDYTGDVVWRFIVHRSNGSSSESRHPVGVLVKAVEDAVIMNKSKDAVREKMPWMPPDMDWFISKAWNDITSLQQLRMNHLIEDKLEVLRKLAIVGDVPRQFPALWSLECDPSAQKALLRMSSDLSGRCYHVPLEINTGSALLARHASILKAGVSLFATVVGDAICLPVIRTALDAAKSAFDTKADHVERVHNLIDKLALSSETFDTRTTSKLTPGASVVLLRDLLKAYDDGLDALEISEISNLECAVTLSGEYVWAHTHEIAAMDGKLTRCSAPPSAWKELEFPEGAPATEAATSSMSTSTTAVSSPDYKSSPKTTFKFNVCVDSVAGLSDWDWHKTYCKWQLYFGRKSLTPLAIDVTPPNGDSSCAPSWSTMRKTIESVASVEMLRECRLAVQVKRRSRIGWTKLIGEGEVWLRDFVGVHASGYLSPSEPVSVSLGDSSDRAVIFHLALER